jgi:outer membrane protein TolC
MIEDRRWKTEKAKLRVGSIINSRSSILYLLSSILFLPGCSRFDSDARMVSADQQRLALLSDPATLAGAMNGPVPASQPATDPARWTDPTAVAMPTTQPATRPAVAGPVLSVTIEQAVLMAMDNNRDLVVQRYAPVIAGYAEQSLYGQFDPTLTGQVTAAKTWPGPGGVGTEALSAQTAVQQFFPTGTTANLGLTANDAGTNLYGDRRDDVTTLRAGLTVTQSLLQGAGTRVNLAGIRQAQLDVLTSQYTLRGFVETLAAETETVYINFLLNQKELQIAQSALAVAESQLDETDAMIKSGKSAASDRAAAAATVAQRREELINALSTLEQTRLQFLRYINGPTAGPGQHWDADVRLVQPPVQISPLDSVESHVRVALLYRAELNEARLQTDRNTLQVVRTKNGILPLLNVFVDLGRTWYYHTPVGPSGGTATNGNTVISGGTVISAPGYRNGAGYDVQVGLNFSYPLLNRAAMADYRSALASRQEAESAVANLAQQVELDVRSAYEEVVRAQEQITASTATLAARDQALEVERGRYRVGKSTSLLVTVAEQDMLNSQNDQATAVSAYLKGLVTLYQLEGSLLERRGIVTSDFPAKDQGVR